jgi:hypothetical protein
MILEPAAGQPVLRSHQKTCKYQRLNAALIDYREISCWRNWRSERNWDPTVSKFVCPNLPRERDWDSTG